MSADETHLTAAQTGPSFELVSVTSAEEQANDSSFLHGNGDGHPFSSDGRFVAFESYGTNLRSGDENDDADLFLRDRTAGVTHFIEEGPFPVDNSGGSSGFSQAALSPDGSLLAYKARVDNYFPDGGECAGTFVVSTDFDGALPPDPIPLRHPSVTSGTFRCVIGQAPSLSDPGHMVFVAGRTAGLVNDEDIDEGDIMLWRMGSSGYERLVDFPYDGGGCNDNSDPEISADGVFIAFRGPLALDGCADLADYIHLRNRFGGSDEVISIRRGSPVRAYFWDLAASGRHVAFTALAGSGYQAYVRDLDAGTTKTVGIRPNGEAFASVDEISISDDGRYVAFGADGGLWYRDTKTETTRRIVSAYNGSNPVVSGNGSAVAFTYLADDLLDDDTNDVHDVYVWDTASRGSVRGRISEGFAAAPHRGGDGHSRVVTGVKVELRQGGQVSYGPVSTNSIGEYHFENVTAGTYRLRVTLEDARHLPGSGMDVRHFEPIFDVRHTQNATAPAWVEAEVEVDGAETRNVAFTDKEDLAEVSPDIDATTVSRLDDMAAIFNRMQDYVGWLIDEIFPVMKSDAVPLPVEIHAFSTATSANNGFYTPVGTNIQFGTGLSDFTSRDGYGNDWGPFAEWHEFTHHLEFVNEIGTSTTSPCNEGNHGGFLNPSTCDSLVEGLAEFLPTLAFPAIEPGDRRWRKGHYPVSGLHLESNDLDSWLRFPLRNGPPDWAYREEYAVAALLWDLVDDNADDERSDVLDTTGARVGYLVTDNVQLDLETLWQLLVQEKIRTVRLLWNRLHARVIGGPAGLKELSIDLDGDGTMDTSPLDVPFLIHGFHPLSSSAATRDLTLYDLRHAAELAIAGTSPNRAVGRTDSHRPEEPAGFRSPRNFPEPVPGATLDIDVTEASGAPVNGGDLVFEVEYPEGFTDVFRYPIGPDGQIPPIQLELPPGIATADADELLDELRGGCTGGSQIAVTVYPQIDGVASDDKESFTNCELNLALAEGAGDEPALSFAFEMPKRPSKLSLRVRKKSRRLIARGALVPASPGSKVALKLQRKRPSGWKKLLGTRALLGHALDPDGDGITLSRYRKKMARRGKGRCRIVARFPGDTGRFPSKAVARFRC